jgi:hypothetical protein
VEVEVEEAAVQLVKQVQLVVRNIPVHSSLYKLGNKMVDTLALQPNVHMDPDFVNQMVLH